MTGQDGRTHCCGWTRRSCSSATLERSGRHRSLARAAGAGPHRAPGSDRHRWRCWQCCMPRCHPGLPPLAKSWSSMAWPIATVGNQGAAGRFRSAAGCFRSAAGRFRSAAGRIRSAARRIRSAARRIRSAAGRIPSLALCVAQQQTVAAQVAASEAPDSLTLGGAGSADCGPAATAPARAAARGRCATDLRWAIPGPRIHLHANLDGRRRHRSTCRNASRQR